MKQQQAGSGKNGESDLVKVGFVDEDGDVETLWARSVGPNAYRIDNVPFFQDGLSVADVVEAVADGDGMPYFTRVLRKSGHRTVRVMLEEPCTDEDPFYSRLVQLGCGIERATPRFLALDVPPDADIESIARHLMTSGVDWVPSDPSCSDAEETDGNA